MLFWRGYTAEQRSTLRALLASRGIEPAPGKAEGRGDCSVLSMMAGHEIKDEAQVLADRTLDLDGALNIGALLGGE